MTDNSDEEMPDIDVETWPRAELVGGPMDGRKIFAPEPKHRVPLAVPEAYANGTGNPNISEPLLHWYVPMMVKNALRKLSLFYYAYAGTSHLDDPEPEVGELYDRSTIAHPEFPEDTSED
jgi:hypothetical protein